MISDAKAIERIKGLLEVVAAAKLPPTAISPLLFFLNANMTEEKMMFVNYQLSQMSQRLQELVATNKILAESMERVLTDNAMRNPPTLPMRDFHPKPPT